MSSDIDSEGLGVLVQNACDEREADILFINEDIYPLLDKRVVARTLERERRKNVVLVLVTTGGHPDVAYRVARCLQDRYDKFSIVISGWCKSAGTILCTGGHEIIFGEHGELGPIDVQIRREDEIGERDSGLSVEAAFESLYRASFRLFENCMMDIKDHSYGSITFKTAAEIASNMAVGMVSPIFAQLDPIKIGETFRSVRIAEEYARRLALESKNLRKTPEYDAISMLVRGYPEHGFVIDRKEAESLFENVSELDGALRDLVNYLGDSAIFPVRPEDTGIAEYLDVETETETGAATDRNVREDEKGPSGESTPVDAGNGEDASASKL